MSRLRPGKRGKGRGDATAPNKTRRDAPTCTVRLLYTDASASDLRILAGFNALARPRTFGHEPSNFSAPLAFQRLPLLIEPDTYHANQRTFSKDAEGSSGTPRNLRLELPSSTRARRSLASRTRSTLLSLLSYFFHWYLVYWRKHSNIGNRDTPSQCQQVM
jgi:hypothetical protein